MVEYGLIGRGIGHSFSASHFNGKFSREGIDARYLAFDLEDISELESVLAAHPSLRGLNVTSPYKRDVIRFLDSLSPEAERLNAVNVVEFVRDGRGGLSLRGHNTDSEGFRLTLPGILPSEDNFALIFGTGGASSAVSLALEKEGIPFSVVSRSPSGKEVGYDEAARLLPRATLVINATPVGMHPRVKECLPIDFSLVRPGQVFYDLIYNPPLSLFLARAAERGAGTVNGLQMLLNQAALAWDIWNR